MRNRIKRFLSRKTTTNGDQLGVEAGRLIIGATASLVAAAAGVIAVRAFADDSGGGPEGAAMPPSIEIEADHQVDGWVGRQQIALASGEIAPSLEVPVFNVFSGISYGIGDESNFVRVRPSNGDATYAGQDGAANQLYVSTLRDDCAVGDTFDVRAYIHNGADDDFNEDGAGSAVAVDVRLRSVAPGPTPARDFAFESTISAANASSVSAKAQLLCETKVELRPVGGSMAVYSKSLGWQSVEGEPDGRVLPLSSHEPGSGQVWACWDERVVVVYRVAVIAQFD